MDEGVKTPRGETAAHQRLKRLALLWAQAQGYSACGVEVSLPQCRFRADVAAFRPAANAIGCTAIFECKQAIPDLRRDNRCSVTVRDRLETLHKRRQVLEKHLRIHYPNLRTGDSLFPEFDSHDFAAIEHRAYASVIRQMAALQNQLFEGTKFEKLMRYRCANVFFLVLPNELFRASEVPIGWGALVELKSSLVLFQTPIWQETSSESRLRFLQRIASAGTRQLNRRLEISFEEIGEARRKDSSAALRPGK
ncbi:MAG: hypothetical protein ABJB22_00975 [Verrucomicrobiota bacterium]